MKRKILLPVGWVLSVFLVFLLGGGYGFYAGKQAEHHKCIQQENTAWTILQ